jgi:alanine racemase
MVEQDDMVEEDGRMLPSDRWAWVEVDLGAVQRNTRAFKERLGSSTRLCAVVKANAYGHGALQVAKACRTAGANAFAVATVAEGVELREGGVEAPIVVLAQPPVTSVEKLVAYRLEPAVYDLELVARLGAAAMDQGTTARYHLAVETGMHRIGVPHDEAADFMRVANRLRGVELAGTFTHFATAENPRGWDFAQQAQNFSAAVESLRELHIDPGVVHAANTPATVLSPKVHLDMVRVGVGLYGLHPADATRPLIDLEPAMSVRARVTRTCELALNDGVGYGMTYRAPRGGVQVATLPLGYADGLSRRLSNNMDVLHHGARRPQVGNVCMDQCMFAVDPSLLARDGRGPRPDPVEVGDVVTVMGRDGDACITADELAQKLGTINYEVVCGFDLRLPKVYV